MLSLFGRTGSGIARFAVEADYTDVAGAQSLRTRVDVWQDPVLLEWRVLQVHLFRGDEPIPFASSGNIQ